MVSDHEFRTLVDQTPFLVWRADVTGACDFFNQRWLDFTGRTLEQELGDGWSQGVHPDDLQACLDIYLDHLRRRAPFEMTYRLRRHDGQYRWIQDNGTPYTNPDGSFAGFIGCCQDVTEQVRARRDLDQFFAVSPDPMCIAGLDGYFRRVNPAFPRRLGYTEQELLSRPWTDFIHPEDRQATIAVGEELRAGRPVENFTNRYLRPDGEVRWLSWSSHSIVEEGLIFAVARDVTLQMQAEAESRENQRRLSEAQRMARVGSWQWNWDLSQGKWSEETYHILGLEPGSEIIPVDEFLARWVVPEDRQALVEALERVRIKGEAVDQQYRFVGPRGQLIWARSKGEPRRAPDGRIVALMGTIQDITDAKLAEQQSRESQRRLAEAQRIAKVGSWEWDIAKDQSAWSTEMFRLLGVPPRNEPLTLDEVTSVLHPNDAPLWRRALDDALAEVKPLNLMIRVQQADGDLRYMRVQGEIQRDAQGRAELMQGTCQDVTERYLYQEGLRESQRRLAEAQRLAAMGSWEWDIQAGAAYWSEELYRLLGREPGHEQMSFAQGLEYIHPEDRDWMEDRVRAALEKGHPYDVIHRAMRADGQARIFHSRAEVVRDNEGRPMRMVGTVQDVTAQRAAQEQLAMAAQVLENSIEGVIITDAEGHIQSVNRAFTIITGFSPEDVLGRKPDLLRSSHHDETFYENIQRSLADNGEWRGEVWHRGKDGQDYPQWMTVTTIKNEKGVVANQIILLHDISDLRRSEEELRHQAYHDALTGLPNRQLLRDRLEVAMAGANRRGRILALIYVDLDNFKTINDSLGHAAGDLLLQALANRLVDLYQGRTTVARLGGDDFVLVLEDLEDAGEAERQAAALMEIMAKPYLVEGEEFYLTTSLGLALFPTHGQQSEVLIKNAELAMYRAKEQGKNAFQVYTPSMNAVVLKRLSLETALRKALEREEFEVHYQPRIDVSGGRMLGMEALVRWRRPEVGLVSPGDFIPIAEETGLIVPIGGWVLRRACRQAKAWVDQGHPDLVVAVNLSARQLRHTSLVATVESALADSGLPPANLELEVTESALMTNVERAVALMQILSRMGLRLVLDDFGTGYSSLYYLKHFPIQALKIDQHFVADIFTDPDDALIVQAVISLANSLKLEVVAEGVETVEQRDFLLAHACHEMQGYLFSRPLPAGEFQLLLERERESQADFWSRTGPERAASPPPRS